MPRVVDNFIRTDCTNKRNNTFWDVDMIVTTKSTMFAVHKTAVEVVILMALAEEILENR